MNLLYYVIIYGILILFLYLERYLRIGPSAKTLGKTDEDQGTTRLIGLVFVLSFLILATAPLFAYFNLGLLYPELYFIILGLLGMFVGLIIRIEAVRELGKYYTSTLRTLSDQKVIQSGMYKYIRHPGYLGNLILFVSAAVTMINFIIIFLILLVLVPAYLKRIRIEEFMLIKRFSNDYIEYKIKTKKLIPFLF